MNFIIKLFKALNSGQTPWQVTLAIVLGMIMGLTPLSGIQTVLILFLALLINIHFGLFLVSGTFFAGVGYVFDPLFESLGYALLSSEALGGLWTAMYNSGIMRLTYFNNTIVLGSHIAALILALPMYFILNRTIESSRDKIVLFIGRYPLLAKLGILKKSDKKDTPFRIIGVGVFAAALALVLAIGILVVDPAIKFALERGLSTATGKDVLIGDVETSFGNASLRISDLEVQDDNGKTNSVSIQNILADLDFNALLLRKKHMELVEITGIGFDTPSSNPKPSSAKQKSDDAESGTSSFAMPDIKLPTPKELLAKADLKSLKVYDQAQKEIDDIKAKWEKAYKEQLSSDALDEYKKDLEAIKSASRSKDPTQLLKLKDDIAAFKKKIDEHKTKLASLKKDFTDDKARISELINKIKNAPKSDYDNLKSAYSLDSGGAINVVGTIFGEKIKHYIALAKKYYALAEPYMKSEKKTEPPKPPRGEGRWIKFKEELPSPDIYVAKVDLSGKLKTQDFTGVIKDIADDQQLLGRTTTFKVTSDGDVVEKFILEGKDDRLGEVAHESAVFSAKRVPLNNYALSSLTLEKSDIALQGSADIYGLSKLELKSSLDFKNTAISIDGLDEKYADIVNSTLSEVKGFYVKTDATGSLESPAVNVKSDLDKKISSALSNVFAKEAKKYEAQLQTMLEEKMQERLKGASASASGLPDVNSLIGSQSTSLDKLLSESTSLKAGSATDSIKNLLPF